MIGKGNSKIKPYALGMVPQSSVYGATIPVILGRTRSALQLIWTQNLREKKHVGKKGSKKGKTTQYAANVDFLLGHNPITALMQFWKNKDEKYTLEFNKYSVAITPGGDTVFNVPDARVYYTFACTLTVDYDLTFNDFGAQGPAALSGTHEIPLWNEALVGPDRVNMSSWRHYPYVWRGIAGDPDLIVETNGLGLLPAGTLNFYYARIPDAAETPLATLNVTFEGELGTGPEYFGYSDQIIVYSAYAGIGSPDYDLGSAQMMPQIAVELMGAHCVHSRGDADFVDMIEDIFKGVAQSTVGEGTNTPAYTQIRHGLDCFEFPGTIQKILRHSDDPFVDVTFPVQTTCRTTAPTDSQVTTRQPSILIAAARNDSGAPLTISDSQTNTWTPQFAGPPNDFQVWISDFPTVQDFDTVTIDPSGDKTDVQLMELSGVDTVHATVTVDGTNGPISGTVTVDSVPGRPVYLLAIVMAKSDALHIQPTGQTTAGYLQPPMHWKNLMVGQGRTFSMYRIVYNPGDYTFHMASDIIGDWVLCLTAFTCGDEPTYTKPLGELLNIDTLEQVRVQCRASGMFGSMVMDSQRKADDYLDELTEAAIAAPVWMGFKMDLVPRSEVSMVGNGAIYNALTADGPIADLDEGDFIADGDEPLVTVNRRSRRDSPNILQIQHPNRDSDYNDVIIAQPDQASISLFGARKSDPKVFRAIQSADIARSVLAVEARRESYLLNEYHFKLQGRWRLLSPMDLVTITDTRIGIVQLPVMIREMLEDAEFNIDVVADPFIYGLNAPIGVQSDSGSTNEPPVANAGADTVVLGHVFLDLDGTATDDGFPVPPGALTYTWSKVSGPGLCDFTPDANTPNAHAQVNVFGTYVLRLTVSDGALSDSDDVTISFVDNSDCPAQVASVTDPFTDTPDPTENIGLFCSWSVIENQNRNSTGQPVTGGTGKLILDSSVISDLSDPAVIAEGSFGRSDVIAPVTLEYLEIKIGSTTVTHTGGSSSGALFLDVYLVTGPASFLQYRRTYDNTGAVTGEAFDFDSFSSPTAVSLSAGDTLGFKNNNGTYTAYKNGTPIGTGTGTAPNNPPILRLSSGADPTVGLESSWSVHAEFDDFKFNDDIP